MAGLYCCVDVTSIGPLESRGTEATLVFPTVLYSQIITRRDLAQQGHVGVFLVGMNYGDDGVWMFLIVACGLLRIYSSDPKRNLRNGELSLPLLLIRR